MSRRHSSILSYLMGRPAEPVADPLVGRLSAWRSARQPALIRLERSHEQVLQTLASTQAEIRAILHQPKHVQATAPNGEYGITIPGADRYTILMRREEGLQALSRALLSRLRSAKQEAEALAEKRLRTQRLAALLDRCRCVYEVRTPFDPQCSYHLPWHSWHPLTLLSTLLVCCLCASARRTRSFLCMHLSLPFRRCSRPRFVRLTRVKGGSSRVGWLRPRSGSCRIH